MKLWSLMVDLSSLILSSNVVCPIQIPAGEPSPIISLWLKRDSCSLPIDKESFQVCALASTKLVQGPTIVLLNNLKNVSLQILTFCWCPVKALGALIHLHIHCKIQWEFQHSVCCRSCSELHWRCLGRFRAKRDGIKIYFCSSSALDICEIRLLCRALRWGNWLGVWGQKKWN